MVLRESLDPDASLWDWLAFDLHHYRNREGLSCAQLGQHLHVNRQAVSNLETGRRGYRLDTPKARILDELWDTGGHFERLIRYARAGHDPDWFKQHTEYEARASAMRTYQGLLIPGLLQTEDYARAWLMAGSAAIDVDAALEVRMRRQEVLYRPSPPSLRVLLDQCALLRPMGGPEVMAGQLSKLLEVSKLPHVSIRVIPLSSGGHLGLEGPFVVTTVEEGDVAYIEACGGGRLSLDKAEVRRYGARYDQIGDLALPLTATRDLIASVMEAMK